MKRFFTIVPALLLWAVCAVSCNDDSDGTPASGGDERTAKAVFVVNEGNYGTGNSSLTYYEPVTGETVEDAFGSFNPAVLGDAAASMTIRGDKGYIVVGGSKVIMVTDTRTFEAVGQITGLTNPRYIHFVSDEKAYVTDLMAGRITVFNPRNYRVTGAIELPEHPSTEQMIRYGDYLFVNCWSYDNKVLVIDTRTDEAATEITVGIQPQSMVLDRNGKIWCLCDGGYDGNPAGYEAPSIWIIDAESRTVETTLTFAEGSTAKPIRADGTGSTIYYILDGNVYSMPADSRQLPTEPFAAGEGGWFYGLGIDPDNGDVYISDALDYKQPGTVYRYDTAGSLKATFKAGVIPGDFCFKPEIR